MKLSKKFTTVTPLSKFIAMALFIILPFLGFYLGIKYQETKQSIEIIAPTTINAHPQNECENNNGVWMKGPFGKEFFCNKTFSDGGKVCNDSMDCLSQQCIVYSGNKIGECAKALTNYGCYGLLVKNRITEYACRD